MSRTKRLAEVRSTEVEGFLGLVWAVAKGMPGEVSPDTGKWASAHRLGFRNGTRRRRWGIGASGSWRRESMAAGVAAGFVTN